MQILILITVIGLTDEPITILHCKKVNIDGILHSFGKICQTTLPNKTTPPNKVLVNFSYLSDFAKSFTEYTWSFLLLSQTQLIKANIICSGQQQLSRVSDWVLCISYQKLARLSLEPGTIYMPTRSSAAEP